MDKSKKQQAHDHQDSNQPETMAEKCQAYLEGWQRAKADYENLKRESEKKYSEIGEFVLAAALLEIIPIKVHFQTALDHLPDEVKNEEWARGFQHVYKQLNDYFKKIGLKKIKTIGEEFNIDEHEAVGRENKPEADDQEIVGELSPGYILNGKVILPAKVIVNIKD